MRPHELTRWRQSERERLIEERVRIPPEVKRRSDRKIRTFLEEAVVELEGAVVSVYWPFRGEPDVRPFMDTVVSRGGRLALPVVVERARPLAFRSWAPDEPLEDGVWGIPVPPPRAELLTPDIIIVPVVGYDEACYRLGYGGGYYDRTLAAFRAKPRFLGVGYALSRLATIHPQPHDVPLDLVITEEGVTEPPGPRPPSPGSIPP